MVSVGNSLTLFSMAATGLKYSFFNNTISHRVIQIDLFCYNQSINQSQRGDQTQNLTQTK